MLHVHFANRHETLTALLLARLPAPGPLAAVFDAPLVIVPGMAVRRRLTLDIAQAQGVCAQLRFAFLSQWLWSLLGRGEDEQAEAAAGADTPGSAAAGSLRAAPLLAWRVHAMLGDAGFVAGHPRLARYLAGADTLMRFELAGRVAELLEQYAAYRPEWLAGWAARGAAAATAAAGGAPDEAWQAALWQRLWQDELASAGPAGPAPTLFDALQRGDEALGWRARLPRQAHVFGLTGMPPLHLAWLQRIGRHCDVHLYVPNPCREHWFDLVAPRRLARLAARRQAQGFEVGNRLLAAWGRSTQVHIEALVDAGGEQMDEDEDYTPHPGSHLLAQLHNAVLELRELAPGSLRPAANDRSIELHVCHSLTRELEVLHDRLLGLLTEPGGLRPGDVAVLLPDLEAAAPLIDAVFGGAPRERAIPYSVTGRARSRADEPAQALLALLDLLGSRMGAAEVFALLQQPIVARRFGLDEDALASLQPALAEAGVRWGLDAAHRAAVLPALADDATPPAGAHTWDDALQRLFLGHALGRDTPADPFCGLLPAGRAEGSRAPALGGLWRFVQALQALQAHTALPRPADDWAAWLLQAVQDFLAPDDAGLEDLQALRRAIARLQQVWRQAGLAAPGAEALPLAVVRAALEAQLADAAHGAVPGGAVTFSALSALRGLPFEMVCLLGLDDGAFPGPARPAEFDLMAAAPRRGDRQRRLDERNLFLDLVLAARSRLHLSHTGRSQRDNAPLPPSVLVAELLDVLVPAIADDPASAESRAAARRRLVVQHPLQPFAAQAFTAEGDPRQRSHDAELAQALREGLRAAAAAAPGRPAAAGEATASGAMAAPAEATDATEATDTAEDSEDADDSGDALGAPAAQAGQAPFFPAPLPPAGAEWFDVSLSQLAEFLRSPARYLLRRRLGLALPRAQDALGGDEPFLPDRDAERELSDRLLPRLLVPHPPDDAALRALARAGVGWPAGALGETALDAQLAALRGFAARVRAATAEPLLPAHGAELCAALDGQPWRFSAQLATLRAGGGVGWRAGPQRPTDLLEGWLQHLALCLAAPPGVALRTRWLSSDMDFAFLPVADPAQHIEILLRLYRQGLTEPLAFFPRSAWAFIEAGGDLDAARKRWQPRHDGGWSESSDEWLRLALRGRPDPLDENFAQLARSVLEPLRAHLDADA